MPELAELADIILQKLTALFVIIDKQGQIEFVSPSVKKVLGFEPYTLMGDGWWQLTRDTGPERDKAKSFARILLNSTSEEPVSFEHILKTAAGGHKWIAWSYSKGPDNSIIGVGHDITERKHAEQQLEIKNRELQTKNTEIIDSIMYATRIQKAILPDVSSIKRSFKEAFVLYKPKDLVSGDFYWHFEKEGRTVVAAVDCTGHGVPGALMSVIANSILRDIVIKRNVLDAAEVLRLLDEEILIALSKSDEGAAASDGLDIALCIFDKEKSLLEFAGAFRPLLRVRDGEISEYRGNRYPIGFYQDVKKDFQAQHIEVQEHDTFYIFSDGYIDQFGGEHGKKMNKPRFKELLLMVQSMDLEEQEAFLEYSLLNWQQETEQTDDILVIGVKY